MTLSGPSVFSKDRELLLALFHFDPARHVWAYAHDDQVFRVMAACAKLNLPCRNVPKDDPNSIEIFQDDWDRIFTAPFSDDSLATTLSQEASMDTPSSENTALDIKALAHNDTPKDTTVRYYRFHDTRRDDNLPPAAQQILLAAESEMADDDEQDMETAVHALAEQTHAVFVSQDIAEEPSISLNPPEPFNPKDPSMTHDDTQTPKHSVTDTSPNSKGFGELSSWEQVLEDRESTLAAREKVLRLRQKDVQDMEERLHEERKAFNADYEEKKSFLEDKEQRLKKSFERIEEIAYEFRRNARSEGEPD